MDRLLRDLQERAKELACLYRVDEILGRRGQALDDLVTAVLATIPTGWQYPEVCVARAVLGRHVYEPAGFHPTSWVQTAPIDTRGQPLGRLEVYYTETRPAADDGPFLAEERRLLETIAERLGRVVAQRESPEQPAASAEIKEGWRVVLEFLRQTDRALLGRLGRKMIHHLCWSGVEEAEELLRRMPGAGERETGEDNRPLPRASLVADAETTEAAFRIAPAHLSDEEILALIQGWIREDKTTFLKHAVERLDTPLAELVESLERFHHGGIEERDLSLPTQLGLRASLVRRFLTDQLRTVDIAKQVLEVEDFRQLARRIVAPARSHGRLGGKSAGLLLAAKILARASGYEEILGSVRIPRSWYIPSDGLLDFIAHNDLSEVHNRKYLDPDRIRVDYPHLVQLFKNSVFSPEILRGLAVVLDDLEGRPLIVRSSSLLEDRLGSAFSGKYKSLFLANTGSKGERLTALTDAIAEVYASVFAPDPIAYRARQGFLDMHEEMGILIQEVVGRRIGPYFLPVFAGVAFTNNEFRWSARIRRDDGLLRLVLGLGTRAVDRLADDYPVLVAPGQPGLRVNQTAADTLRYAPKRIDVINLESASFETIELRGFLARWGEQLPMLRQLVSVFEHDHLRRSTGLLDLEHDEVVLSFEGLIAETSFVPRIRTLMRVLSERLETAVDVEFAYDGEEIYLLQCRPQGATHGDLPVAIPADLPRERVLFTANRYVSNGRVGDVSHVVYVDPEAYGRLPLPRLKEVARVVGRLNRLLPARGFVLIGPGRWGSRGDVRLGVPVTYADISNAAVLIEVARQRGGYLPDLSFGTHFFQDLVESSIRYLPLYPDDPDVVFAEPFFRDSPNRLADLLPDAADLAEVVRVIDVGAVAPGLVLHVLMNGELERAVGLLAAPARDGEPAAEPALALPAREPLEEPWRWRLRLARALAAQLDPERFGVRALYLAGSTKDAKAGPESDIDLIVHLRSLRSPLRHELELWLEGWSRALAELNFQRTGVRRDGLLDVSFVDDEDVARRRGPAARIGAITDAARPLPLAHEPPD